MSELSDRHPHASMGDGTSEEIKEPVFFPVGLRSEGWTTNDPAVRREQELVN